MHVAGVRFTTLFILTHIKRFFIVFQTNYWTDVFVVRLLAGRVRVKFAALQSFARRKVHKVLSFACGTRDKLKQRAARSGNPTCSSGQRSSPKKTRFPVGKRVFGRTVNVLGNYSSSLSLASSASSVSTSWLSSSSREAMSSLIAPLAGAFLSSIGAPRSSSSASA